MGLLHWVLVASAPALFWLWLFYRRDRWEPEPKLRVLKLFALGAVAAAPAYWLEGWLPGPHTRLFDNYVRVALTEEVFKLLPVVVVMFRHRDFNEPMDGIVYAVAAALGFATVENGLYAFWLGPELLVQRAFTATLAHVGFSGLAGYALGVAKFAPAGRAWIVGRAFVLVVLFHGTYDLALSVASRAPAYVARTTIAVTVPAVLVLLWWSCNRACAASPFRSDVRANDADEKRPRAGSRLREPCSPAESDSPDRTHSGRGG